jgi:hypothetical protein
MANATLTKQSTGREWPLPGASEHGSTVESDINLISAPGLGSGEAIALPFTRSGQHTITGVASGIQLAERADYPDQPRDAAATFARRLEYLCSLQQGATGYEYDDPVRNQQYQGVCTEVTWEVEGGQPYSCRYSVTLTQGSGTFQTGTREPIDAVPDATWSLNNYNLYQFDRLAATKRIEVDVFELALVDSPSENQVLPASGVTRDWTIQGVVNDNSVGLQTFDDRIRDLIGTGDGYTFDTAFPGYEPEVVVASYEPTVSAGVTAQSEYLLDVVEATAD